MVDYKILKGDLSDEVKSSFIEMGHSAFLESNFNGLINFNESKLIEVAQTYAVMDNKVLITAVDGDEIVGVFAGYHGPWYFSDEKIARDVLWYVKESYRESGVGLFLLGLFEEWSRLEGVKAIWLGQDSGIDTSKFSKILESRGYNFIGANYSLGVN